MSDETPRVLALLAHELRGPLGVIRGYLRLLTQTGTELSEKSRRTVDAALRASDRIGEIVDDASLFAHLHIGDLPMERRRVPLPSVVHAAIQSVALPDSSTVTLDAGDIPSIMIDADLTRLRDALAALITAIARAQTTSAIVEIIASNARLAQNKAAIRLRIGPRTLSGVDAIETDLDIKRGGLGLTVPIAAVVVAQHGGRVRELRHGDRSAGIVVTLPTT